LSGAAAPASGLLLAGWSPDGRNVLVWPDPESSASLAADGMPLVAVPVDGGPLTQLTEAMLPRPDFLAWSPDGQRLALVGGAGRTTWERKALVVATLAGGQQRVSDGDRVDLFPAWSPDGQWLAVASAAAAPGVGGGDEAARALDQRRIWLMRPDGTDRRPLLEQSPARDERPRWSADGSRLLWVRVPQHGQPQVWLARVDRAEPPQLVADGLGLGTAAPAMGADEWFGFYGYVEWAALYDWWQPAPSV
jgi:Tol biopolymer transport system component